MRKGPRVLAAMLGAASVVVAPGCATVPANAFEVDPDREADRAGESRRLEGVTPDAALAAGVEVLTGQGLTVTQVEERVGLAVARKVTVTEKPFLAALSVMTSVLAMIAGQPFSGGGSWVDVEQLRANVVVTPGRGESPSSCDIRLGLQKVNGRPADDKVLIRGDDTFVRRNVDPSAWPTFFEALARSLGSGPGLEAAREAAGVPAREAEPAAVPVADPHPDTVRRIREVLPKLLDRGFLVDQVDLAAGTVVASRFFEHRLRVILTVRPGADDDPWLPPTIEFNGKAVDDPELRAQLVDAILSQNLPK